MNMPEMLFFNIDILGALLSCIAIGIQRVVLRRLLKLEALKQTSSVSKHTHTPQPVLVAPSQIITDNVMLPVAVAVVARVWNERRSGAHDTSRLLVTSSVIRRVLGILKPGHATATQGSKSVQLQLISEKKSPMGYTPATA